MHIDDDDFFKNYVSRAMYDKTVEVLLNGVAAARGQALLEASERCRVVGQDPVFRDGAMACATHLADMRELYSREGSVALHQAAILRAIQDRLKARAMEMEDPHAHDPYMDGMAAGVLEASREVEKHLGAFIDVGAKIAELKNDSPPKEEVGVVGQFTRLQQQIFDIGARVNTLCASLALMKDPSAPKEP